MTVWDFFVVTAMFIDANQALVMLVAKYIRLLLKNSDCRTLR